MHTQTPIKLILDQQTNILITSCITDTYNVQLYEVDMWQMHCSGPKDVQWSGWSCLDVTKKQKYIWAMKVTAFEQVRQPIAHHGVPEGCSGGNLLTRIFESHSVKWTHLFSGHSFHSFETEWNPNPLSWCKNINTCMFFGERIFQ